MGRAQLVCSIAGAALIAASATAASKQSMLTRDERHALLRRAQIWRRTNVASMDMRAGPQIKGAFAPGETVTCDYVEEKFSGKSPKFSCVRAPDDRLKVRYGRMNGEVYASVAATRLLWALGFGADAVYPVRIVCRGCPRSIEGDSLPGRSETRFDVAAVERKFPGRDLETHPDSGWSWDELADVTDAAGGAPLAQRDALKLLAVMLQHTDNKAQQQRLVCLDKDAEDGRTDTQDADCARPFLLIHDVGLTFGRANIPNRNDLGSVNLERWAAVPIWKDAARCVGYLTPSETGTLSNPPIAESGRKFLAGLLNQLTDRQIADMFLVARFGERPLPNGVGGSPIESWVEVFKKKRAEITSTTCP